MMFTHALRLEFLKQRHLFFSLAAILFSTAIVTVLRQLVVDGAIREGLAGIFFLMAVAGIPLATLLLGGSAGAELRASSARWIEESLPFHPRTTFLTAYLISLLHTFLIILPVFIGLTLLGEIRGINLLLDFRWSNIALPLLILQLHTLSFTNSYITRRTIIGSASALTICGIQLSLFLVPNQGYSPYWLSDGTLAAVLYLVAAVSPFLYSFLVISQTKVLQRNGQLATTIWFSIITLLLAAPIALWIHSLHKSHRFEMDLSPLWTLSELYHAGNPMKGGALFATASGTAVHISPQGQKIILGKKIDFTFGNVTFGDHLAWVLTSEGNDRYAIRYAEYGELKDYTLFTSPDVTPTTIVVREGLLYLFGTISGEGQFYAELKNPNGQPSWQKNTWESHYIERSFEPLIDKGKAAFLSTDRKQLIRRLLDGNIQSWPLSGTVAEDMLAIRSLIHLPAFTTNRGPGFLLVVKDAESKQRLILCRPDGTISEPWKHMRHDLSERMYVRHIPGGGVAVFSQPADFLYVLNSEGSAFMPVRVPPVSKETFVQIKRLTGDHLWIMVTGKRFMKIDLQTGSHSLLAQLPKDSMISMSTAEEGIYFTHEGEILLLTWDGNQRPVTSAKLN